MHDNERLGFAEFNGMTLAERERVVVETLVGSFAFLTNSARPLRATLKQVSTAQLDLRSRDVLDACFPGFRGQQEMADWLARGGITDEITSTGTVPSAAGRLRRFAGDASLPGGRYFSVCRDTLGNDGGTLVWELMTYWNAMAGAFPGLVDSTVDLDPPTDAKVRADIPRLGNRPFLLLKASKVNSATAERIELGDTIAAFLPLAVTHTDIDHVIDLRLPETQDGFAETLGFLESVMGWIGPQVFVKERPTTFLEILPTLITPRPGGTAFHQSVGVLCRMAGVDGLVFPSARRNVYVTSRRNGEVQSCDGWNFVDYRNAGIHLAADSEEGTQQLMRMFGRQIKWLRDTDVGVRIDWQDDGTQRTWRVSGAEEGERRRYDIEWEIRRRVRTPSPMWTTWFAGRGASG